MSESHHPSEMPVDGTHRPDRAHRANGANGANGTNGGHLNDEHVNADSASSIPMDRVIINEPVGMDHLNAGPINRGRILAEPPVTEQEFDRFFMSLPEAGSRSLSSDRSSEGPSERDTSPNAGLVNGHPTVQQALDIARDSPEGIQDPTVRSILEDALGRIWSKVQAAPDAYVMSRDEFAVFNFFQDRFAGDQVATAARKRYWEHFRA